MILPFTGCRFGGLGGSRGRVGTRAFAGHMTRFPASETCAFLSQFFTKLRGEFWEVLSVNHGRLFLVNIHRTPCDKDCFD